MTDATALVDQLEVNSDRLDEARERVEEYGQDDLEDLQESYREFMALLDRYEDQVTGDDGDARTIIEFQSQIHEVMTSVPDDVLLADRFEEVDEYLQQKWFKTSDFEHVRERMEPAGDLVARLEELTEARKAYRETRTKARKRMRELGQRIDDLERLTRLGDADLDAPTDRLRTPIETYNEAVADAFAAFRSDASARAVVDFLETMEAYPLVPFESPPAELVTYVHEHPPGEESIPTLLEYADYSRSKLDHYVDDPVALTEAIGHRQTYFERLDADPLQIAWPPPPAGRLSWRCRELTAAVNRFAPDMVEHLRAVEALPRETDYERLRDSARAAANLTAEERERLTSGAVQDELEQARANRELLQDALAEYPTV